MKPMVPKSEGPARPIPVRLTEPMLDRIDAVAKATGNERSETIRHLLRWALDEYDAQRAAEKAGKK